METGASLQAPVTVRKLQRALHAQVKGALAPYCTFVRSIWLALGRSEASAGKK